MNPLVSIVVPVYNGERYIDDCMKRLLEQTYAPLEILLVDDGSGDGSGSICDRYAAAVSHVRVIHQENGGPSRARNTGIAHAQGKYLMFTDVDDLLQADAVEKNVRIAEESDADMLMFGFWYYDVANDRKVTRPMKTSFCGSREEFFRDCLVETVETEVINAPWNKVFRREFLREQNLAFDPQIRIYEDLYFSLQAVSRAHKIAVNPELFYQYNVQTQGTQLNSYDPRFFDNITKIYHYAMDFCREFSEHEEQEMAFCRVYSGLGLTFLKQLSCRRGIADSERKEIVRRICQEQDFLEAVKKSGLQGKRRLLYLLLKTQSTRWIIALYRSWNGIQQRCF
mgnify:FL=1